MAQTQMVRGVHTDVTTVNGVTIVTYRGTPVVRFNDVSVVFETKGYRTTTTKRRITQALNQFDLKMQVFQKDFGWFVSALWYATAVDFEEGRTYPRWDRIASFLMGSQRDLAVRALSPTEDGLEARKVLLDLFAENPGVLPAPLLRGEKK